MLYDDKSVGAMTTVEICGFGLGTVQTKDPVSTKGSGHRAQTHDRGVLGTGTQGPNVTMIVCSQQGRTLATCVMASGGHRG